MASPVRASPVATGTTPPIDRLGSRIASTGAGARLVAVSGAGVTAATSSAVGVRGKETSSLGDR